MADKSQLESIYVGIIRRGRSVSADWPNPETYTCNPAPPPHTHTHQARDLQP